MIESQIKKLSRKGYLFEKANDKKIRCLACGHRCLIAAGHNGICRVRFNENGQLRVPGGYVGALQCDPIEKKPFFHVLPGSRTLSFGMLGCDFHCAYCQNWTISQAVRDPDAGAPLIPSTPSSLCEEAARSGARILTSTYNEPLITAEWAVEIFKESKKRGFRNAFVSNGNGTPEVLATLRPWVDFYKVDLKSFRDSPYRQLGGNLEKILETIRSLHRLRFWVEVVTLLVPGFNDSDEELRDVTRFLVGVSPDIPWHVTVFHKDYKMTAPDNTSPKSLLRAAELGKEAGLRYVYAGNRPGDVGQWENTSCPHCGNVVVVREGFRVKNNALSEKEGRCPECGEKVAGVWA